MHNDDGGTDGGQVQFNSLLAQGALVRNENEEDDPVFSGAGGFERLWDECSSTPFLRSTAFEQIITYDDPESLAMKGAFAKYSGMMGVNMFDVHGDEGWALTDSVRKSLGLK